MISINHQQPFWECPGGKGIGGALWLTDRKKKNGGPQFESPEETKCCQPLWEYGSRSFITSRTTEKTASLADIWISALQWPRLNYSWTPPDLQKLCDAKYM